MDLKSVAPKFALTPFRAVPRFPWLKVDLALSDPQPDYPLFPWLPCMLDSHQVAILGSVCDADNVS